MVSVSIIGKSGQAARLVSIIKKIRGVKLQYIYYYKDDNFKKPITNNFQDLLNSDAIIIASPTSTHAEYLIKLKKYKGYVLVEKPLVSNEKELKRIVGLSSKKIKVNYNFQNSKLAISIKKLIDSGKIGKPVSLQINTCHGLAFKKEYLNSWRSNINKSFGVLELVGTHFIDFAISLFGDVVAYNFFPQWLALCEKRFPPDTVSLKMKMKKGVIVDLRHSYAGPFLNKILLIGTDGYLDYDGEYVKIYYPRDVFDKNNRFVSSKARIKKIKFVDNWNKSLKTALKIFFNTVNNRGKFLKSDMATAVKAVKLVDRIKINK